MTQILVSQKQPTAAITRRMCLSVPTGVLSKRHPNKNLIRRKPQSGAIAQVPNQVSTKCCVGPAEVFQPHADLRDHLAVVCRQSTAASLPPEGRILRASVTAQNHIEWSFRFSSQRAVSACTQCSLASSDCSRKHTRLRRFSPSTYCKRTARDFSDSSR